MAHTSGVKHTVLYDYDGTNQDELTIRTGQTVYVTEQLEKGWARGRLGDTVGMFPASYVEIDSSASTSMSGPLVSPHVGSPSVTANNFNGIPYPIVVAAGNQVALVNSDFAVKDSSQLPLKKDEYVLVLKKFPSGWGTGEIGGKQGMFPLANVRILDSSEYPAQFVVASPHSSSFSTSSSLLPPPPSSSSNTATSVTATTKKSSADKSDRISRVKSVTLSAATVATANENEDDDDGDSTKATVIFDYKAIDKGQLNLTKGDVVYVLDKLAGGWWKGRTMDGQVGFFPGTYVKEQAGSPNVPSAYSPSLGREAVADSVTSTGSQSNLKRASTVSSSLRRASAVYSYVANSPSELSFNQGDEIIVYPVRDGESSGWSTGALATAPTVVAHFPSSYVKFDDIKSIDSSLSSKEKISKRKSQPAHKKEKTAASGPPTSKPPPRPDSNGKSPPPEPAVDSVELAQALKTAEQAKQGLVKLQQQTKVAIEGMLERLETQDKERARLETGMRNLMAAFQQSESARAKLEQQNKWLYSQVVELRSQIQTENKPKSTLPL